MDHETPALIVRRKPVAEGNDITLEEWLAYLASSSVLKARPQTERPGINPFTREPVIFHSAPGAATFEGPGGPCEIEYHAGGLLVRGAVGRAEGVVGEIADALGAAVEVYNPVDSRP